MHFPTNFLTWTMEKGGNERIEIAGIDNKRQLTAVFVGTLAADFFPVQLLYKGKTTKCLPTTVRFPCDWSLSYSANHWSNEQTMNEYLKRVILPYVVKKKEEIHLQEDHQALVIFDFLRHNALRNL